MTHPPEDPRVSIVTGATSGIGREVALCLAARGDRVLAIGRNPERLAALQADLDAAAPDLGHEALSLDVASEVDMGALRDRLEKIGRADVLVASAVVGRGLSAGALPPPTARLPVEDWQLMVDVNLHGVFLANMAVLPVMRAGEGGDILNIGSSLTPKGMRGTALAPAYSATKYALAQFSRDLDAEVAEEGIRVRTIFPGAVSTPLIAGTALEGPYGGSIPADSFARSLIAMLDFPDDMAVIDPYILPVPRRGGAAKPAPGPAKGET